MFLKLHLCVTGQNIWIFHLAEMNRLTMRDTEFRFCVFRNALAKALPVMSVYSTMWAI